MYVIGGYSGDKEFGSDAWLAQPVILERGRSRAAGDLALVNESLETCSTSLHAPSLVTIQRNGQAIMAKDSSVGMPQKAALKPAEDMQQLMEGSQWKATKRKRVAAPPAASPAAAQRLPATDVTNTPPPAPVRQHDRAAALAYVPAVLAGTPSVCMSPSCLAALCS